MLRMFGRLPKEGREELDMIMITATVMASDLLILL